MERQDPTNEKALGIVVGYDGTESSQFALDWAAQAAARDGRRLTLVHCVDLNAVATFPMYDPAIESAERDDLADDMLGLAVERAAQHLDRSDITAERVMSSASAGLVDLSHGADLVVTGSRQHGRLRAGLLGSTAYAVTAHAVCPAVVVRGTPGEPAVHAGPSHPVIVGIDDSKEALHALDTAAVIAAASEAALHIVRVLDRSHVEALTLADSGLGGPLSGGLAGSGRDLATATGPTLREHVEQSVAEARERVEAAHPGLAVETEVREGEPGHVLGGLSDGAGLVVLGSHGHGGFVGMLLGSVSHRVIHDATCPVMVVR